MSNRASIRGTLRDRNGQAVSNAIVMITDGPESFSDMASVTDEGGGFTLSNIAYPGTYVLQIRDGDRSVSREVEISGPQPVQVVL